MSSYNSATFADVEATKGLPRIVANRPPACVYNSTQIAAELDQPGTGGEVWAPSTPRVAAQPALGSDPSLRWCS